ncbi:13906_t:CDS:1, partial [Acaulospora morrowiae]
MAKNKKQPINALSETLSSTDNVYKLKADWFQESMAREHYKYCYASLKVLKRHPSVFPFLEPVDPVKYGIPDYYDIIKKPMDLSTVERKLSNLEYSSVNDFANDVRLVFSNCILYNGVSHQYSVFAKELNNLFSQQLSKMPGVVEEQGLKAESSKLASKTCKTPTEQIFEATERPKRTIRPTSKELPDSTSIKRRKSKSNIELNYCRETLRELRKKVHWPYAYPFYEPVDPEKLGIPDYFKIISRPMDMSTINSKLENDQYSNADEFEADIRLMFQNCYVYNGPNSEVGNMGKMLEAVFDKKWAVKPALDSNSLQKSKKARSSVVRSKTVMDESSDASELSSDESDSQEKWRRGLEEHLKAIQEEIEMFKKSKSSKSKKALKHEMAKLSSKIHGKSVPAGKSKTLKRPRSPKSKAKRKKLTQHQKKILSEKIIMLSKESMAHIINLVRERNAPIEEDDQGEVSFEIDDLDPQLAREIYDYTMDNLPKESKSKKGKPPVKRLRTNSASQSNEEQIKALENALVKFDKKLPSPTEVSNGNPDNLNGSSSGSHSSSDDSSSDSQSSDSSGSDSE